MNKTEKAKHKIVVRESRYILKFMDETGRYIHAITPVTTTLDVNKAYIFSGQWLDETVWKWRIFYEALEVK